MAYLIEFRFNGYSKKYARDLIYDVARRFKVKGVTRKRAVPHITLFGPFNTRYQKRVVSEIVEIGKKYSLVAFKVKGFNYFGNIKNKVIYLDIEPSKNLENLRWEIAKRLLPFCKTKSIHDKKRKFYFHSTIAFKDIDRKFLKIWNYIKRKEEPNIRQHLLRITILKGGKILYEYDLIQKKLLNRKQARSKYIWKKTIELLKKKPINFEEEFKKGNLLEEILDFFKMR